VAFPELMERDGSENALRVADVSRIIIAVRRGMVAGINSGKMITGNILL